jgi:N-acetyl-anhydromuramyl-L-alanine amidase AmpD
MTLFGGALLALEDRPGPAPAAFAALTAGASQDNSAGLESIFTRSTKVQPERWQGVVIHHSATRGGSPEALDQHHRDAGLNGLGYHFVISNGQGSPDGSIHVGRRWLDQTAGAHTVGPNADWYNNNTIGICLIGDGERRRFTKAQLASLAQLTGALQDKLSLDMGSVILHRDVAPTASPGRLFPNIAFRRSLLDRAD